MKRLNNILSYLWSLLLFLTLTTCSDWEEIVVTMQMEEEVELTIQTEISGMKGSTRTVPTENISSITALAFDSNSQLIKVVTAKLSNTQATSGELKIKVPKRTVDIHFVAKNGSNKPNPDITINIGDNVSSLSTQASSDLHYWGKTTFDGTNATLPVSLYRNMAKVTLEAGNDDYIAGFLNYNTSGNIVPYSNEGFDFGSKKNYITLPYGVTSTSHDGTNESLGTEHYLFEHANEKNNNPLYAICNIGGKYYKIAFAYTNNGSVTYFDIIRNNAYKIVISDIDELYGEDSFENAKNENTQPINDLVITEGDPLTINATPAELPTTQGGTCSVTVAIPQGITELMVDADAVFTVTPADVTLTDGKCDVNGKETVTFTLTVNANATTGDKKVSFSGRGKYMTAIGSTSIRLYQIENVTLPITPDAPTVGNTEGSTTQLTVKIPDGITSLSIDTDAFDITSNDVTLNNGSWDVSDKQGQSVTFTLELKANGTASDTKTVTFNGSGQYKRATGTATVTLQDNALSNVNLMVAVSDEDPNNPSMIYGQNSEEDLYVKVTIPAGVTALAFSSEYFDIASASDLKKTGDGGAEYLSVSGNSYTVNHQGEESITLPFRLRLKNNVQNTPASFTFTGSGETINNASATKNVTLQQRNPDDGSVYWEGYLPLNQADNTTKISIPKDKLNSAVNRVMRIECEKTQDNQALALLNNWNQFNPDMQYSTATIDVPLTQDFVNSITDNLIITGRGAEGMLMKKVSFLQLQTVQITAALTPQITSLNYSANSVSDLIVNVTIPAGVTTLNFSSEYFEVGVVNDKHLTDNGDGTYTRIDNNQVSTYIRLRLKNETTTENVGFTFSGAGNNLYVIPAEVNNIKLQESGDENVRWQGDVLLNWDANGSAVQIPLPYSWFYDANNQLIIPVGSTLHLEYELTSESNASIQFAECKDTWNDDAYYFSELHTEYNNNGNNETMGLNLDNNTGIYSDHRTSIDLTLTQAVLDNMKENRTNLLGETDVVMAIQGGNVRLKKISVIPATENPNNPVGIELLDAPHTFTTEDNGNWTSLTFNGPFPIGTKITLNFSKGGGIKLCDNSNHNLYVEAILNTLQQQQGSYSEDKGNLWMNVPNGDLVLEITSDIVLYNKGNNPGNGVLLENNPLNGLVIESGETVLERVTVTYPQ